MIRILLIYYSQAGEAARVAAALASALQAPGVQLVVEPLRPVVAYPYPWRRVGQFFSILPECHLGPLCALEPPTFDPAEKVDLVILVYQVWFLAPSLPVQSFLSSEAARVLQGRKVMTVSVSRNMWQSASETMKQRLQDAGARQVDNVVVTHQGPAWATFLTTPRALLYGQKGGFWGVIPPAGVSAADLERVARCGEAILKQRDRLQDPADHRPLLRGLGAVRVDRRAVIPELVGWYWFRCWARLLRGLGQRSAWARQVGVYLFAVSLVLMIVAGIPLVRLTCLLLYPLIRRGTARYSSRLEQPSGP